jgi:hypothetical protein
MNGQRSYKGQAIQITHRIEPWRDNEWEIISNVLDNPLYADSRQEKREKVAYLEGYIDGLREAGEV